MARHARARRQAPGRSRDTGKDLVAAVQAYQSGDHKKTRTICTRILRRAPAQIDALNLAGAASLKSGYIEDAIDAFSRAASLAPDNAELHANHGVACLEAGQFAEAEAALGSALAIDPAFARARFDLARALRCQNRPEEAIASYEAAIAISPTLLAAHLALADLYAERQEFEPALARFETALAVCPGEVTAENGRAAALAELGRLDEAVAAFEAALAAQPANADIIENLASAHRRSGDLAAAELCLRQAFAIDPHRPSVQLALASVLRARGAIDEAMSHVEDGLKLAPDHAELAYFRGLLCTDRGELDAAVAAFDRAIALDGSYADPRFGRALVHLQRGNFADGWRDYAWRDGPPSAGVAAQPLRLARDLDGRRIVLETDQGLGDELFFLRFVAELKARGAWVAARPDPRLADMLTRAGVLDEVLVPGAMVPCDDSLLAADVPYALGPEPAESTPCSIVLPVKEAAAATIRERLIACGPPPWLGITWRAGTRDRDRRLSKDAPLAAIAEALRGVPATLIALQRAPEDSEVDTFAGLVGRDLHDFSALNSDLEAMLALSGALDEYVCVSNTNLHLRAATGGACRVLVPFPPEFRWMEVGDESPWFPGSRIYRQQVDGSWDAALTALAHDLRAVDWSSRRNSR